MPVLHESQPKINCWMSNCHHIYVYMSNRFFWALYNTQILGPSHYIGLLKSETYMSQPGTAYAPHSPDERQVLSVSKTRSGERRIPHLSRRSWHQLVCKLYLPLLISDPSLCANWSRGSLPVQLGNKFTGLFFKVSDQCPPLYWFSFFFI
jgi:hypothetical protein